MVILGVDPGTTATGYGVIEKNGSQAKHVASGVVRPSRKDSQSRRLWHIHGKLEQIICEHAPSVMVVESLFHANNSQSLMKLSQARGVILLLGEAHGMEIYEYAPREIKKGLTGYGAAEKEQIMFMVAQILKVPELCSPDQADALAMALYHCHICRPCGEVQ